MDDAQSLGRLLRRIDGAGYRAYKELSGRAYALGELGRTTLFVDHVQGDPFAAPSKMRLRVDLPSARLPASLMNRPVRRIALADFLARRVRDVIDRVISGRRGSGKSGLVRIDAGGQEILERSAVVVADAFVEARIEVGLPAAGRRVLGRAADLLLTGQLPKIAELGLLARHLDLDEAERFVDCAENQEFLRMQLAEHRLVAFVADGAVLPRRSGASDFPMEGSQVVPSTAPEALRVTLELHNPVVGSGGDEQRSITGLGVPEGVTLIVGGGYHGKSTLLRALERGIYRHVPGDGREQVVTRSDAVKIRAEDGRRVCGVDISAFIDRLPQGADTRRFTSDDASGSTSQAAGILEAVEVGAQVLLLDEDTSATNFMLRDARMQALVHPEHEPITPFLDRVRELYERCGVSSVLVMGGCGDYFDVADTVILMRDYQAHDATDDAREVAASHPSARRKERESALQPPRDRIPRADSFDASRGRREVKIDARGVDRIAYGEEDIELRGVEQLVDASQTRAVGHAIHLAAQELMDGKRPLTAILDALESRLDTEGLDLLNPLPRPGRHPGNYARPRRFEIAAAINRLRSVRLHEAGPAGGRSHTRSRD